MMSDHNLIPNGVLANHGELQCSYCGASNLCQPKPEDFDCAKNPNRPKDDIVELIKKAYELNIKSAADGGCPPCCACCAIIIKLGERL